MTTTVILSPQLRAEARIARRKFMDRIGRAAGQEHHNARLTDIEVTLMRELYVKGMNSTPLAEKFGVPVVSVKSICYGRTRAGGARKEKEAAYRLESAMNCMVVAKGEELEE